ncbi:glycosyltransferase family 9 protein [candidate division KSB1 bacterium]|nr:glycosyltransferase family 9 protein [candidate division KSB1 bacterium]
MQIKTIITSIRKYIKLDLIHIYLFRLFMFCIQKLIYPLRRFQKEPVNKILIVRLKHLGDLLLSVPLIQSLQRYYPGATLSIATGSWNREIAEDIIRDVKKVYYYNVTKYCRAKDQIVPIQARLAILREISQRRFDLVIDLDGSVGFLFLYLFKRVTFVSSIESLRFQQNLAQLGLIENDRTNYNIHSQHELLNLAASIRRLGFDLIPDSMRLQIKRETEQFIHAYFAKNLIVTTRPLIGIHPAASTRQKLWSTENFAKLAEELIQRFRAQIIFFGTPTERERIERIQAKMTSGSITASDLSLPQFIAAMNRCQLLICLDSLAQHVAFLQGVPAVVIYRSDNFVRWTPGDSENMAVIFKKEGAEVADIMSNLPPAFLKKIETALR